MARTAGERFNARMRRAVSGIGLAALLAACAVSCSGAGTSPAAVREGSGAVRVLIGDPSSLSLIGNPDTYSEVLAVQITDSLFQYDAELRLVPRLAQSWEVSESGREVILRLRPGVRWHDGAPVTAHDVVFTVNQVRLPELANHLYLPRFAQLESIEALDDLTVRARYSAATPDDFEGWRVPLLPKHLAGVEPKLLESEFARHPVGCGPFRFVHYRPGEEILLEANDDYWDGRPVIDRLVFRIYPDDRTAFEVLLAGELDVMHAVPDFYVRALREHPERLAGFVEPRMRLFHVQWNLAGDSLFRDPRVRRALVHALDREQFIERVMHGFARSAASLYFPESPWADPELKPLAYDLELARSLLDEAGWRDTDGDGVREREGRPFRFTLSIVASSQRINDELASWLQQGWAEIGVAATIDKSEFQHWRERRDSGRFEACMGSISLSPTPDQYEMLHSTQRTRANHGSFADAEVDRLLEQGRGEFDEPARRAIYYALQRRLVELQPTAALFHFPTPILHDKRLTGLRASPLGYMRIVEGPRLWKWLEPAAAPTR